MPKPKLSNVLIVENSKGGVYIVDNQKNSTPTKKLLKKSLKNENNVKW